MLARKWPHSRLSRCSTIEHYGPSHCEAAGRALPALLGKAGQVISFKNGMRKNDGPPIECFAGDPRHFLHERELGK